MKAKVYKDERGWKYRVMPGIGGGAYKARYQKTDHTGDYGWKGVQRMKWWPTFEDAQSELDKKAAEKGWTLCLN